MMLGGAIGSVIPIGGTLIGGLIGGAIFGAAGLWAGEAAGAGLSAAFGGSSTLQGREASDYLRVLRASRRTSILAGERALEDNRMYTSGAFRELLAQKNTGKALSAADSIATQRLITQAAGDAGVDEAKVLDALAATGTTFNLAGGFDVAGGTTVEGANKTLAGFFNEASLDVNYSLSENADILSRYLKASEAGTDTEETAKEFALAKAGMRKAGESTKGVDALAKQFKSAGNKEEILASLGTIAEFGSSKEFSSGMGGVSGYIESLIAEQETSGKADVKAKRARFNELLGSQDKDKALFDALRKGEFGGLIEDDSASIKAIRALSASDITGLSAQELARKAGVDTGYAQSLKDEVMNKGMDTGQALADLQFRALTAASSESDKSPEDRERDISRNLSQAATQLKELATIVQSMKK
jgi:hypothetical protein